MNPSCKFTFFPSSTTTTITQTFYDDQFTTPETIQIPIQSPSIETPTTPISVHGVDLSQSDSDAATKIQSAYRAHLIRTLYRRISTVSSEADHLQCQIQQQETVDSIRRNEREKLRMNEALMGLLLRLDSVPGVNPIVREARRKVSRRIVGLQEILDGICEAKACGELYDDGWDTHGGGFLRNWDEVMAHMEEEVCRERGGEEMERFCAQHLGFRCLQRFLSQP